MIIETAELVNQTGATARQIDYWCRNGIIETVGSPNPGMGFRREFDDSIVSRVRFLAAISKKFEHHFAEGMLKQLYNNYEKGFLDLGDGIVLKWT